MTTSPALEKAMDEKIDWLSGDGLAARKMTCKAHGTVDCSYCWKVNLRELRASRSLPSGGDVGEIRKRHEAQIASQARTIEALRAQIKWADDLYAALACLKATHNEIWNNQCEEAYRGYADASNASAP